MVPCSFHRWNWAVGRSGGLCKYQSVRRSRCTDVEGTLFISIVCSSYKGLFGIMHTALVAENSQRQNIHTRNNSLFLCHTIPQIFILFKLGPGMVKCKLLDKAWIVSLLETERAFFFIGRFFSILESWNPRGTGTLGVSAAGHNQSPCAAQVILQIICMHSAWTFLA